MAEIAYFRLHDLIQLKSGNTPNKDEASFWGGNINWVSASSMHSDLIYDSELKLTIKGSERTRVFAPNTIVILVRGSMLWNRIPICRLANKAAINQDVKAVLVINDKLDSDYLFHWLQAKETNIKQAVIGTGIGAGKLETDYLYNLQIGIPSLQRQSKTIRIFSAIDQKINLLTKKKEALEAYKKGLMQKIFSQELRFKRDDGTDYPEWMSLKLKDVLEEYSLKTTINDQHPILSSTNSGLYLQSDYFKHQVASKDNVGYKVIRAGMVVLSPQNLWMGNININQEFEVGIVSPSYKIFKHSFLDDTIAKEWLINPRMLFNYMQASEQGASIVRRNLSLTDFYDIRISIPSNSEELCRISKVISSLDREILNLTKKLEKSIKLKKGLLQQMFV